jgi:hypothetical protein
MKISQGEHQAHGNFTFIEFIDERDRLVSQIVAVTGQSAADVMTTVRMANAGRPNTMVVLAALRVILADAEGKENTSSISPF